MTGTLERSVRLAAPADQVWAFVTSFAGINHELWPVLRMTEPPEVGAARTLDVQPPARLGRSRLLALRFIPVDYDDIGIEEYEPPHRFLERSAMLSARRWEHERTLVPYGTGCILTDRIDFECRFPPTAALLRRLVHWLFAHRHARLIAYFNTH